ncbi:meckelin-like [Pollicipes pollicipes]|uniref:meckelin-like n=1 Tax=Pollicipes pollicipes TaxID=41117 RepID=UPI0018852C0D|nr:meckelin-like [Pollicipes pollicipes]
MPVFMSYLAASAGGCGCPDGHLVLDGSCIGAAELNQVPSEPSMYTVEYGDGTAIDSAFFRRHTRAAAFLCRFRHNISACHLLANLCTMGLYSHREVASACGQFRLLSPSHLRTPPHVPWLYYAEDEAQTVLGRTRITQEYTVRPALTSSYLNLTVARFSAAGRLLGRSPLDGTTSTICPQLFSSPAAALRFGSRFDQTCTVSGRELLAAQETEFYELYLHYQTEQGPRLYAVPVRVKNYRREGREVNKLDDRQQWQLVHRFFLLDVTSGVAAVSEGDADQAGPELVQYVQDAVLSVQMQDDKERPGRIFPPLLTLTYGLLKRDQQDRAVRLRVRVQYSTNMANSREQVEVAVGVMSAFAAVWAIFRTWAWSSRNGKAEVDSMTLVHLVVCSCGSLANVFLLVMFCTCFYWFIFFKRQEVAYSLLPTPDQELIVRNLVISAFVLKTVDVAWLLWRQVNIGLFLLDWERPKARSTMPHPHLPPGADGTDTVSIWRTYFIANEWNELQTERKVNQTWQLMIVLFALEIVGFAQLGSADPDARMDYGEGELRPPDSFICRFCVLVLVYVTVAVLQWIFTSGLYERFVEDKMQQFVDLCSISNISVFILYEKNYGFYIHGRSVHGHADADLHGLHEQLRREEEDLCSRRGLLPGADQQTFQILLPNTFRLHYDNLMAPMQQTAGSGGQRAAGGDATAGAPRELHPSVQAYNTINKFLAAFIEHAIKELDYTVKDKKFIEAMIDIEFADSDEKGVFYNDGGQSFQRALLYGNACALTVFDILLFCFVDILSSNVLLATIVVFCTGKLVDSGRYFFGRRNLAKKTLVDERFLV